MLSLSFLCYENYVIPESDHEDVEGSCQDLLPLGRVNPVGFEDADVSVDTQAQRDDLKSGIAHSGAMNNCVVDTEAQRDDLKSDIAHSGAMNNFTVAPKPGGMI